MLARSRPLALAALAALAVVPACRKETIDKPDAPPMADVLDAFASPTGTFDAATAAAVRQSIDDAASGLLGAGVTDRIVSAIDDAVRQAQSSGKSTTKAGSVAPRAFSGDGFGRVTRLCDGWAAEPVPDDPANGHLVLTFTFDVTHLDPVIWGNADRCLYTIGGKRLRLDRGPSPDDLRLYVGERTTVEALATTPLVLALDVAATIDDKPVTSKLAVRFVYKAALLEVLVPVTDGSVVVTVSGTNVQGVRAKNGTFQCDVATRRCTGGASGDVTL